MVHKDKSYRFLLSQELFDAAQRKADREDVILAQVMRRLLSAWVANEIELPPYRELGESIED